MKIIVSPDSKGLISRDGRIVGQPAPDTAVIVEVDTLELAPVDGVPRAARVKAGRVEIVPDYRGWVGYKAKASTADRLSLVEITEAGVTPSDLGLQAEPRPETKAEELARSRADAASAEAERLARVAAITVSRRAFARACAASGLISMDEALAWATQTGLPAVISDAITALPDDQRDSLRFTLLTEPEFVRGAASTEMLRTLLGKSAAEVDRLFETAATL